MSAQQLNGCRIDDWIVVARLGNGHWVLHAVATGNRLPVSSDRVKL